MSGAVKRRDYRLTGPEKTLAQAKGLVDAQWYATPIPRQRLKELMKRKDGPAIRDTILWLALMAGTGTLAYISWGTWWAIPAFAVYGIIYSATGDSRWHECGHGTAFRTPWMNDVVYQIASFMNFRAPTPWRWSHTRHHSDTYIVGRDPEISSPRPPVWRILLMQLFHLYGGTRDLKRVVLHAFGKMDPSEQEYVPAQDYRKTFLMSRIWLLILVGVIVWCVLTKSLLPAMLIGLPTFYGPLLRYMFGVTQHLGLHEDVLDHRLNTRTMYLNPFFRFLYWNMNYHIEHHMYPMVPYHALPALHEELKYDMPKPNPSLLSALKEVVTALWKQRKDPRYTVERTLPPTAHPYYWPPQSQ